MACLLLALGLAKAAGAERPGLAPFVYRVDFESGELRAWASYPPNQDTAYDPYVYPGMIRPRDQARCLVVKCDGLLLVLDPWGGLFTAEATFVALGGARLVESPERFAGQFHVTADGLAGLLRLQAEAVLRINTGSRPGRVLIDGKPTNGFTFDPGTGSLSLRCAAGETKIEVTHER